MRATIVAALTTAAAGLLLVGCGGTSTPTATGPCSNLNWSGTPQAGDAAATQACAAALAREDEANGFGATP
jgi:hypothetical protein